MPRTPTPSLGLIPLQPQANPTNQFFQPEVRQENPHNQTLLGLAHGLSAIEPGLIQIVERRQEVGVVNAQKRADAAAAWIRNRKQLKQAVDEGKIPEAGNPHYWIQLQANVAANEATDATLALRADYFNDPIQTTDSPQAVEDWAFQKLSPLLKERNQYEMSAIAPVVQNGMHRLVQEHIERRRAIEKDEMEDSFKTGIGDDIDSAYDLSFSPTASEVRDPSKYAVAGPWQTKLNKTDEKSFREWVGKNNVPFNPDDANPDYDMRGFWSAQQAGDPKTASSVNPNDQQIHYPDNWKTPHHASFSNESKYAKPNAPRWINNHQLADETGRIVFDEKKGGSTDVADHLAASVQGRLDTIGQTVSFSKSNRWAVDVILNEALARQDAGLAEQVLGRVRTSAGRTLLDTPGAKASVERLREQVVSHQQADIEREERNQAIVARRESLTLLDAMETRLAALRKTNPTATEFDVIPTWEELGQLSPETKSEFLQRAMAAAGHSEAIQSVQEKDQVNQLSTTLLKGRLEGTLTPTQDRSLIEIIAEKNGGRNALLDVDRIVYDAKHRKDDAETDPAAERSLQERWASGKLTPDAVFSVYDKLSKSDRVSYLRQSLEEKKKDDAGLFGKDGGMSLEMKYLERRVMAGAMRTEGIEDPEEFHQSGELYVKATNSAEAAVSTLAKAYDVFLRKNPDATADEKMKELDKLSDEASRRFGGLSRGEFEARAYGPPNAATTKPAVQPKAPPAPAGQKPEKKPFPEISESSRRDPIIGSVTDQSLSTLKWAVNTPSVNPERKTEPSIYDPDETGVVTVFGGPQRSYFTGNFSLWDPLAALIHRRRGFKETDPQEVSGAVWVNDHDIRLTDNVRQMDLDVQIETYNKSMARRLGLKNRLLGTGDVQKFMDLATTLDEKRMKGIPPSFKEKESFLLLANELHEYALLSHWVGYTAAEAKEMGHDAWQHVPLFANEKDLLRRGEAVMKDLGVTTRDQMTKFAIAQRDILNRLSETPLSN